MRQLAPTSALFGLCRGVPAIWSSKLPTIRCLYFDCASGVAAWVTLLQLGELLQSTQSEA